MGGWMLFTHKGNAADTQETQKHIQKTVEELKTLGFGEETAQINKSNTQKLDMNQSLNSETSAT